MLESKATTTPYWEQTLPEDEHLAHQIEHAREQHLLLDPRPPAEVNKIVLAAMMKTGPTFWLVVMGLGSLTLMLFATWGVQIFRGVGITGLNRSVMWGPYIANLIYFIGVGHAGTFISAALRMMRTVSGHMPRSSTWSRVNQPTPIASDPATASPVSHSLP